LRTASSLRITKLIAVVEVGEARFRTTSKVMTSNPVWAQRGDLELASATAEDEVGWSLRTSTRPTLNLLLLLRASE
jgi:hypothetical protein